MYLEYLGWIGSIALQLHTLPQVFQCYKQKHASGFSGSFLAMWVFGCLAMLIYTIPTGKIPLIINYLLNSVTGIIVTYYKVRYK